MANKLLKPKRGRVENLPKLAVEDGSLIFAYDTKSPTSTVLVDVGETRYELSAATAKKADDSNALGGSSLQNIVDKIDNATGDGTAFIGLDTTTNNKVKLTRANGTTVEKTINNVSNASTADYAKVSNKIGTGTVGSSTKPVYINAGTPTAINSIPSTFVTAQQINGINLDTLRTPGRYFANGSNTNTGKPTGVDAFALEILQSAGGWYTQICYASNNQEKQFVRYYNSGTSSWSDWIEQNRLNTKTQSGYAPAPNAANKVYRTDASGNPGWGTLNDSSISKLASTVTFGDGNGMRIEQNGNNQRQRINIFDSSQTTQSYSYQQSIDAGKTYKDLFVIGNDGTVVASTFKGALKGTADYSKNSGALGGSSLQNIVDKINNSTGNGTAFTGLDITTNNKVKLTRANGGTVEKTINNVSNASTADYAKDSDKLDGYHETDFLRYRGATGISADSLWNQIGIKEFDNCYPDGLNGIYPYGAVVSLPTPNIRFDIWVNHQSSNGVTNGLQYRSGWTTDKKPWRMLLDSVNFTQYAANKNAYNSASVSNATITLGRSDGTTGTTLTVNNVAHATNADLAKNSNALGGSSLKNITDKIDLSIAANDAMHYMGTLGATAQKPTITTLPATARTGDAYKVITAGTYSSIAAEVGDLFIYSGSWTLIPSGDDGNVYVGDSKSSKFAAKSNNIVVAVGDQKVASAENVTANAGTISALQSTLTQLKANQGTVTTLNGNKATFSTVNGYLNGNADSATRLKSQGVAPSAISGTARHAQAGVQMMEIYNSSGYPTYYGNTLIIKGDTHSGESQLAFGWSGNPSMFIRSRDDWAQHDWTNWSRFILSTDALASSASAISSTNNYFTAGATTAYVAAKTASAVGNYLPLSGGTMNGTAIIRWADSGTWGNTTTFPVKRGGLSWTGQSDGIELFAEETGSDNLELIAKFTDDNSNGFTIRNASNNQVIRLAASGAITGGSLGVSGGISGSNLSISGRGVQLNRRNGAANGRISWWDSSYHTWISYMSDPIDGAAPTGGKPSVFGDVTSLAQRSLIQNRSGYGWIWESAAEGTMTSTLAVTPLMSLGSATGNLKVKGTVTATTVNAYLNGTAKNADTVDGFHAVDSNSLTASATSAKIVLAKNVVSYISSLGLATTSQLEWIEF